MGAVIFLLGMFIAALFAIFTYGYLGVPPSFEKIWVDYVFWAIIFVSAIPLVMEALRSMFCKLRSELGMPCHQFTDLQH